MSKERGHEGTDDRVVPRPRDGAQIVRVQLRPVDSTGLAAVAEVAAQLPDPTSLARGTLVVVGDVAKGGALSRLFRRGAGVKPVVRASALLARGYVAIEAGRDETGTGLVWGLTST